ncbi:hypothetical protein ABPG77_009169 [Micractinium sp. CCAP 211/92]
MAATATRCSPITCRAGPVRAQAQKPQVSTRPAPFMLRFKAATVAGAAAALLAAVPAGQAADLALGEEVFNNNCAACHIGGNNNVIPERTLRKEAIQQYLDGGLTLDAIVYQVENGKGAMPAWEGRLSDDEIQAVASYVLKQAEGNLW